MKLAILSFRVVDICVAFLLSFINNLIIYRSILTCVKWKCAKKVFCLKKIFLLQFDEEYLAMKILYIESFSTILIEWYLHNGHSIGLNINLF